MYKKMLAFFLSAILACSLVACSGPKKQESSDNTKKEDTSQDTENQKDEDPESDSQKPVLDADATDEELLDLVKDDITVVTEKKFAKTVADMKEHVEDVSGQLYQMEGFYTEIDGIPYLTDSLESEEANSLPLRYVIETPKEGARIRVTGVAETDEEAEEQAVVFSIVVLETLE